ncbi:MAG: hypothetical protein PHQ89_04685 [Bacilli bacterium]|nr:hypothetical protein [Bacilli bacterium]
MHDNDKLTKELLGVYRELSPEYQQSFLWCIKNFEYIESLIKGDSIPIDKLNEGIEYAINHNDFILHILLLFKKVTSIK